MKKTNSSVTHDVKYAELFNPHKMKNHDQSNGELQKDLSWTDPTKKIHEAITNLRFILSCE